MGLNLIFHNPGALPGTSIVDNVIQKGKELDYKQWTKVADLKKKVERIIVENEEIRKLAVEIGESVNYESHRIIVEEVFSMAVWYIKARLAEGKAGRESEFGKFEDLFS